MSHHATSGDQWSLALETQPSTANMSGGVCCVSICALRVVSCCKRIAGTHLGVDVSLHASVHQVAQHGCRVHRCQVCTPCLALSASCLPSSGCCDVLKAAFVSFSIAEVRPAARTKKPASITCTATVARLTCVQSVPANKTVLACRLGHSIGILASFTAQGPGAREVTFIVGSNITKHSPSKACWCKCCIRIVPRCTLSARVGDPSEVARRAVHTDGGTLLQRLLPECATAQVR